MRVTALCVVVMTLVGTPVADAQSSARERRQAVEYLRKGQDLLRTEQFDRAREAFTTATTLDPFLELAHYGLGQVAMAIKEYPAAVRAFTACRAAFLSNEAQALSDSTIAEQRIDDQVRELKDTALALSRGRVTTRDKDATAGRLNAQIHELEARRHRAPGAAPQTPPWISIALGSAHFRTNAMADAEREYRAAIEVDPALGEGHNNLAVVLMLTGRYADAEREVKAAEDNGFVVSPQFKADLRKRGGG
jgi:tetratricopeptide (TPR) repeat protein